MRIEGIRFLPAALRDIDAIADHYLAEAGLVVALRFTDAIDEALRHVARQPAIGFLRYAHALDIPDLRAWPIRGFPHMIC